MHLENRVPKVLGSWLGYVRAYQHLAEHAPDPLPAPTLELTSAFAGAMVADLAGGVADPLACGVHVVLPNGSQAIVAVASDAFGVRAGMTIDPARCSAEWVALVAFRGYDPVAIHVIDSRHLAEVGRALGGWEPAPADAPAGAVTLSTFLHWDLCLEPVTARVLGVRTYWISAGGVREVPLPVAEPPPRCPYRASV